MLKIDVLGNAQLGDDLSMLAGCAKGTIDGALIATSLISSAVPEMGILNAPYLFGNVGHARAVLESSIGAEFMELSRAKNLPVLAWGENGLRHISSNKAVRTVADLQGLKLRVPQSAVMLNGMRALGADAVPLSFGLLRGALQSGEFQAQENAISVVESSKLYEMQKYLCLTGHIYDAVGFIASADLLEDLTETQRVALASCARKGAAVTRQVSDAAAKNGIAHLRSLGMTIIEDVDFAGFPGRGASLPRKPPIDLRRGTREGPALHARLAYARLKTHCHSRKLMRVHSIRTRIFGGFAALILLQAVVGVSVWRADHRVEAANAADTVAEVALERITTLSSKTVSSAAGVGGVRPYRTG